MKAKSAAYIVNSHCRDVWPDDWRAMAPTSFGAFAASGLFNTVDSGSHKYIPKDVLNADLGLPDGAGVYGYWKFDDGSYVLLCCSPYGLAVWDGKGKAEHTRLNEPKAKEREDGRADKAENPQES